MIKKFLKLVFAVMLVLGMTTSTIYAANGSATITIKKGDDINESLSGMRVNAYKVLQQVNDSETTVDKKQYKVTTEFVNFFNISDVDNVFTGSADSTSIVYLGYKDNQLVSSTIKENGYIAIKNAQLDKTYPEADLVSRITGDDVSSSDLSKFYTWLEKYIETKSINVTKTESASETQAQFTNLDEGYYALTFANVPNGISVRQGILIATPGEIVLKAEPLTVTKTVSKEPDDNFAEKISAAMSDTLYYHIDSTVPTLEDYTNLTEFKFTDTFAHQTVNGTSFKIVIDDTQEFTLDGTAFKLNGIGQTIATLNLDATHNTFIVNFITSALEAYQGKAVELQYSAQLTTDAIDINNNDVTLTYINNGSTGTLTDKTEVYTYGLKIQKTFSDHSTDATKYEKVKFKLYADDGNKKGNQILLVGGNGVYTTAGTGTTGSNDALVLSKMGELQITGLDAGTYWLEETEAPDGYTKSDIIKITLEGSDNTLSSNSSAAIVHSESEENLTVSIEKETASIALATFEVLNQKGFNLPTTGGAGTWMMTIGGIVLIAAAGSLYVISKKKKHNLD